MMAGAASRAGRALGCSRYGGGTLADCSVDENPYLRRAAEQLRSAALDNLALLRLGAFTDEVKRETFEELIEEIRTLKKGAFAPLSEQPFIRAILFPSGGLGLLAGGVGRDRPAAGARGRGGPGPRRDDGLPRR